MTTTRRVLRMAAFPDGERGGNPAGVVLDAGELDVAQMQRIAASVGYAETAFVTSALALDTDVLDVRYFSPLAEVPFCGHATIATAVALARRSGARRLIFHTPAGPFAVRTRDQDDRVVAAFVSADPHLRELPSSVLDRLLSVLHLRREDLSSDHPPRLADAGNEHPIVVLEEKDRFDTVTFDPLALRSLMVEQHWVATVTILHCSGPERIEARNLFPVGTMNEDPATGSAAAAVGGYLRELRLVRPPTQVTIRQGHHLGLPCVLSVFIPATGGITVSGSARDCAPPLLVAT